VTVFWNPAERRLRAPWRLLLHVLLLAAGTLVIGLPLSLPFALISAAEGPQPAEGAGTYYPPSVALPWSLAALVGALLSTSVAALLLDRRRLDGLGLRMSAVWAADLGFGLALGVAMVAEVFVIEARMGWVEVTGFGALAGGPAAFGAQLIVSAVIFVCVGVYEELITRGYQMTNLAEGLTSRTWGACGGVVAGLVVSSIVFGAAHYANPGASPLAIANITLAGALLLGLAYALTGRLGLSIGLHVSWNFAQSAIFGFPVSGIVLGRAPALMTRTHGPELWTGAGFGPEGGLLGTIAFLSGCVAVLLWVRLREGRVAIREEIATPPVPVAPARDQALHVR